jgi:hypothetical protein
MNWLYQAPRPFTLYNEITVTTNSQFTAVGEKLPYLPFKTDHNSLVSEGYLGGLTSQPVQE